MMTLDDGHEVWFVDPRTFGEVVVFDPDNVAVELPELAMLGVDPIAEPFTRADVRTDHALHRPGTQAVAARPARDRRHRQHLRRRDPARRQAPARSAGVVARRTGDCPAARVDRGRAHRRHRRRRLDARRLPVRGSDGRRVGRTRTTIGCTGAAASGVSRVAGAGSAGRPPPVAAPTSASVCQH